MMPNKKILLVGSGAREHAIAKAICRSEQNPSLLVFASNDNPGIRELATAFTVGNINDASAVATWAQSVEATIAIVGPEAPLEQGVADALWSVGIPVVGPRKALAQLETSKEFTRDLLSKYSVGGCPAYRAFASMEGVAEFLEELGDRYVIKADGLMGGKGVKVAGDHLHSHAEAIDYCEWILAKGSTFVIEEKMIGVEFSLISLCGGSTFLHFPAVQDHKRAFDGDTGPNTGGMGSYSDVGFSLPFLDQADILEAKRMNEKVAESLLKEVGEPYKGVLYGGFMATSQGTMIVEYNARFGDPEVLNLLTLYKGDFVSLMEAVIADDLSEKPGDFINQASVCKYLVPEGYPDAPQKGFPVTIGPLEGCELYLGAVDMDDGHLVATGSRTLALVATADSINGAEAVVEKELQKISGALFHRKDIGTQPLIDQRIATMQSLRPNT
jgi:phosphoribosylamine--glycine ligase